MDHQIRQLGEQHKNQGDDGDHGPAAALVDHQRRQPALKLVGQRRHRHHQRRQQRQQQQHRRPLGEHQGQAEAQHGRQEHDQSQADERAEIVDQEGARERHGQVQELLQRQRLGPLQLDDHSDCPAEDKGDDQSVPDVHEDGGGCLGQDE